jgi:hypothetical protein
VRDAMEETWSSVVFLKAVRRTPPPGNVAVPHAGPVSHPAGRPSTGGRDTNFTAAERERGLMGQSGRMFRVTPTADRAGSWTYGHP